MELIFRRAVFDGDILALDEASFLEALAERGYQVAGVGKRRTAENPDPRHRRLLRACRERPRCRASKQPDERATLHSITSSARASSVGGTVRPSALAVVRLMTRSNLVGCSTGMSPGFTPRRILST